MAKNDKQNAAENTPEKDVNQTPETPQEETAEVPEEQEIFTVTREQMEKMEGLAKALAAEQDKYLRLAAEYDNYRKRTAKEKESLWTDVKADTAGAFLPVYDNLERALNQPTEDAAYKKGVEMTMVQFNQTLEKLGITEIPALGEKFDPNVHNAVMHVEDESLGENEVVEVFQKGFKLNDKVIRFAMVKVAN